jgi:AcrR family transcriptional regulator
MKPDKRQLILEAAETVFARTPFDRASMEEVAKLAGVAKGTLYLYFASKEELYAVTLRGKFQNLLEQLDSAYHRREDPVFNLYSLITHLHGYMLKHPEFYQVFLSEYFDRSRNFRPEMEDIRSRLTAVTGVILESGRGKGIFRSQEAEGLMVSVLGTILVSVRECLRTPCEATRLREIRREIVQRLCQGLLLTGEAWHPEFLQPQGLMRKPLQENMI